MGRRSNQEGELSREAILKEAILLFREKGYRATSLENVADKLGVTRPSIYYYYKTKGDILLNAHLKAVDAIFRSSEEIIDRPISDKDKFIKLIENHITVVAKNAALIGIFYQEEKELPKGSRIGELLEKRNRYTDVLVSIYMGGINEGVFRDTNPKLAVLTILGACNWVYKWYREDGELSPEALAKIMVKTLSAGYLK